MFHEVIDSKAKGYFYKLEKGGRLIRWCGVTAAGCLSVDETVVSVSTRALVTGGLHRLGEAVRRALTVAMAAVAETAVAETAVTVAEST